MASSTASFAGGDVADNGTFSVVASNGATITGSLKDDDDAKSDDDFVTATVAGQTVTAARTPIFGPRDDIPGRFTGTARAADGSTFDVKLVIDS